MQWKTKPGILRKVEETEFELACQGRCVPGILWRPEKHAEQGKLVLLGHGGSSHKRADYVLAVARWLARSHGIASLAIDGPGHGDRISIDQKPDFRAAWGSVEATANIVADWQAALSAVQGHIGEGPVAYWGLSMGTMMGIPLVAAESRISVAVFGTMGIWGPNSEQLR
ncbi:MAG: alpha/beta hydrolase, partial [Pseudomonadales bacterium]|nr:alpha/beta hydrolase [Pseudomonadales bacterium]